MGLFTPVRQWLGRTRPPFVEPDDFAFRELAEHSSDMLCRIGGDGSAKYFSPAALDLFGWTPEEMKSMDPRDFFFPEDMPILNAATGRLYSGESRIEVCEVRTRRRDGSMAWVETRTRVAPSDVPGVPGDLIVVLRDITDRKQAEQQLAQLALVDGLTGIANRRAFEVRLQRSWEETLNSGGEMSLLLLDIDRFKQFNDRFGHHAGDGCLRTVAVAIEEAVRPTGGLAARYGGEEFAVVLPLADIGEAGRVAEAVRASVWAIQLPHPDNVLPFVTVSVGAATAMARDGASIAMPSGLIQTADAALYNAKGHGRNRVETSLLLTAKD